MVVVTATAKVVVTSGGWNKGSSNNTCGVSSRNYKDSCETSSGNSGNNNWNTDDIVVVNQYN